MNDNGCLLYSLTYNHLKRGKYDTALDIFNKILRGLELKHEDEPHYLIGSTHHNIGLIRMWKGHFESAIVAFQKAIEIRKAAFRKPHPDIGVSHVRESICHFALGHFDDAVKSMEQGLEYFKKETSARAKILNNLGVMHYHRQDLIQALKGFTGALEIQRQRLAGPVKREPIVFDASITLCNMGKLFLEKQDHETAYAVFEEALMLQTIAFRKESPLVMISMGNLAYSKAKNGETQKALQMYKGVLRSQEAAYGPESREAIETCGIMGFLHKQLMDNQDALTALKRVEKWQTYNLSANDPATKHVKETLRKVQEKIQGEVSVWI